MADARGCLREQAYADQPDQVVGEVVEALAPVALHQLAGLLVVTQLAVGHCQATGEAGNAGIVLDTRLHQLHELVQPTLVQTDREELARVERECVGFPRLHRRLGQPLGLVEISSDARL